MNKFLKYIITGISAFAIYENILFAQNPDNRNFFIESKFQYGFLWQHRPSLAEIIGGNIKVFDISFGKQTYGQKIWDQLYRYPTIGLGYTYVDFGNPEEIGHANAFLGYFDIPFIRSKKQLFGYRLSGGLAYLNKGNIAIGTHLNLYFDASLVYRWYFAKHWELINAFGATHFSNGAIKMPNLGLNLFSYRLGFRYHFQYPEKEFIKLDLPDIDKRNSISIFGAIGTKEKRPDGNIPYSVASFSLDYLRILSLKHKIGLGFDTFYDESLFELMNPDSTLNLSTADIMRYGIHAAFEARIYKLMLAIHIGTYIHANYKDDGSIYQRVALRYILTKNIYANVSLKTSKGVADYVEWGIGYRFYWK